MLVPVIKVDNVSKHFIIRKDKSLKERVVNAGRSKVHREEFQALSDISFTINSGESVGLVGHNGSGKSTLLKLIGGIISPDKGSVQYRGRVAALLELGAGFHPDLTGRENVYLNASIMGCSQQETDAIFDEIVAFSGIEDFIDTQVKFYSSGMYVRLAFSVAVHSDPDIILIDEVLAVGDIPFQRKCMDKIRQFQEEGRTIVFVSHSPEQVATVCDRAIMLEKGHMIVDGVPGDVLAALHSGYNRSELLEQQSIRELEGKPPTELSELAVASRFPVQTTPLLAIKSGTHVSFHGRIKFQSHMDIWKLNIVLETPTGQLVYTTTRSYERGKDYGEENDFRFVVNLDDIHLGAGNYTVSYLIKDHLDREVDRAGRVLSFTVLSEDPCAGFIHCNPDIVLEPLSA